MFFFCCLFVCFVVLSGGPTMGRFFTATIDEIIVQLAVLPFSLVNAINIPINIS